MKLADKVAMLAKAERLGWGRQVAMFLHTEDERRRRNGWMHYRNAESRICPPPLSEEEKARRRAWTRDWFEYQRLLAKNLAS